MLATHYPKNISFSLGSNALKINPNDFSHAELADVFSNGEKVIGRKLLVHKNHCYYGVLMTNTTPSPSQEGWEGENDQQQHNCRPYHFPELTINYLIRASTSRLSAYSTGTPTISNYTLLNNNPESPKNNGVYPILQQWDGENEHSHYNSPNFLPYSIQHAPKMRIMSTHSHSCHHHHRNHHRNHQNHEPCYDIYIWSKTTKMYELSKKYMIHPLADYTIAPIPEIYQDMKDYDARLREESDYFGESYYLFDE